jgi:hypothetical protein
MSHVIGGDRAESVGGRTIDFKAALCGEQPCWDGRMGTCPVEQRARMGALRLAVPRAAESRLSTSGNLRQRGRDRRGIGRWWQNLR